MISPSLQIPEAHPPCGPAEVDVNVTPGQAPERIVLFQAGTWEIYLDNGKPPMISNGVSWDLTRPNGD